MSVLLWQSEKGKKNAQVEMFTHIYIRCHSCILTSQLIQPFCRNTRFRQIEVTQIILQPHSPLRLQGHSSICQVSLSHGDELLTPPFSHSKCLPWQPETARKIPDSWIILIAIRETDQSNTKHRHSICLGVSLLEPQDIERLVYFFCSSLLLRRSLKTNLHH